MQYSLTWLMPALEAAGLKVAPNGRLAGDVAPNCPASPESGGARMQFQFEHYFATIAVTR